MFKKTKLIDLNNPAHPSHSDYLISTNGWRAEIIWYPDNPLYENTVEELLDEWDAEVIEQCGFIDSEQDIWFVDNSHNNPRQNFLMNEKHMAETLQTIYNKEKRKVLGIFHTHPTNIPWPSPRDIVGWPNSKLNWRYFIVTQKEVGEWKLIK